MHVCIKICLKYGHVIGVGKRNYFPCANYTGNVYSEQLILVNSLNLREIILSLNMA